MKEVTSELIKLPSRKPDSHKGENGRVLIVGGSPEYIGSPALAGIAAMRSGADSVVIAAPAKVAWAINAFSPDLVTLKLTGERLSQENEPEIAPYLEKADCLLIGPGISEHRESMNLIKRILKTYEGPKILDAAALFAFDAAKLQNSILLPNVKEFIRLSAAVKVESIIENENIIVQKSASTMIRSKQGDFKNHTGNAGLTKAGTGDVLAGLVAGFLAQSKDSLQSCINAVYFTGLLGDILLKEKGGYFYLASDLAETVRRIHSMTVTHPPVH